MSLNKKPAEEFLQMIRGSKHLALWIFRLYLVAKLPYVSGHVTLVILE